MKPLILSMSILALSLSACRNTSLNPGQGGSSLQGVYDDDYSLQISQVPEKEGLYQFEVCLLERSQDSCVAALKNGDQSVTFSIDTLPIEELALSDQEQRSLLKMQSEWGEYKARQKDFKTSEVIGATIGGVGGAVVIGSTASMMNLHNKARSGLLQAEEMRQQIWDQQLWDRRANQAPSKQAGPDWYKKYKYEYKYWTDNFQAPVYDRVHKYQHKITKDDALAKMLSIEKKLNKYGYSTTVTPQKTIPARAHIFSSKFINYLKSTEVTEYLKANHIEDDILEIFKKQVHSYPSIDSSHFSYIIKKFINGEVGRTSTDIIDPQFLEKFLDFMDMSNKYYTNAEFIPNEKSILSNKRLVEGIRNALSGEFPELVLDDLENFLRYQGVPHEVLSDIEANSRAFGAFRRSFPDSIRKNPSLNLENTLTAFKKSEAYMNPARKLTQESAEQISKIFRKSLPVVIIGAITTVAILNQSKQQAQAAEEPLKQKELEISKLNVLLNHSSPLMSTDPSKNVEVPSVKDVLTYLALAWQGVSTINVTHYCYPKLTGESTVEADCHDQRNSI